MIEIRELNKSALLAYIGSEEFESSMDIPITLHRALSQTKNPRLQEDQTILLLAYDSGKMVGYLGILPDTYFIKNEVPIQVGWLSCLWVSPISRGQGIGEKLLVKSMDLWDNKILSADYVPATKVLYDRISRFVATPYSKKGIRLYLKFDLSHILPQKKAVFSKFTGLLKTIDICANGFLNLRLSRYKEDLGSLSFEYIDQIDEEVNVFIQKRQEPEPFKRNKEDLNWMINNPWILSAEQKSELNKKFYFSSTEPSFDFYLLKVRNVDKKLIAFLIFSKRNQSLKLPYFYHENCLHSVIRIINHHLVKWKINTFTCLREELAEAIRQQKSPAIFKKVIKRNYLVSTDIEEAFFQSELLIQDGDGDCGFT